MWFKGETNIKPFLRVPDKCLRGTPPTKMVFLFECPSKQGHQLQKNNNKNEEPEDRCDPPPPFCSPAVLSQRLGVGVDHRVVAHNAWGHLASSVWVNARVSVLFCATYRPAKGEEKVSGKLKRECFLFAEKWEVWRMEDC